jgi:hypothetical protein
MAHREWRTGAIREIRKIRKIRVSTFWWVAEVRRDRNGAEDPTPETQNFTEYEIAIPAELPDTLSPCVAPRKNRSILLSG